MSRKIYVVGNAKYYHSFVTNGELTTNMEMADIVLFTGGEDVSPSYYDEKKNIYTSANIHRDKFEAEEFYKAVSLDKLLVGICRGAQFLTVLSGGKLVQHVDNHALCHTHKITFYDTHAIFPITSTHHQMMYPYSMEEEDYDVLAVSSVNLSSMYLGEPGQVYNMKEEPEIVYYPKTRSLGIQGHPEQMNRKDHVVLKINSIIENLLYNGNI